MEEMKTKEEYIIKPCPRCGSEEITVKGMAWIQVSCVDCGCTGQPFSYSSRCHRYTEAINAWNELFKEVNTL